MHAPVTENAHCPARNWKASILIDTRKVYVFANVGRTRVALIFEQMQLLECNVKC